jgi:hypothetical protein
MEVSCQWSVVRYRNRPSHLPQTYSHEPPYQNEPTDNNEPLTTDN